MIPSHSKILVVDDMLSMRKLITKALREASFTEITEASNGAEAWQLLDSAQPPFEVILSDWNMPESNGEDLLKRVRGDARFQKKIFILLSTEGEKKEISETIQKSCNCLLTKPFNTGSLKAALESCSKA